MKKKKHEHVDHERWLVSYADFITLLFAFFVVMFAASNADQKKAGKVAQSVQNAFQTMAVFSPSSRTVPLLEEGGPPSDSKAIVGSLHPAFEPAKIMPQAAKNTPAGEIAHVKEALEQALSQEISEKSVRIKEDERGLTVSLAEAGFFAPGEAEMRRRATDVLDRIASRLNALNLPVRVEGHTDDTPIHTAQFPSNWELSTARATHVLQYLLAAKFPPGRLSAAGYAEQRPAAPNTTAEGRAVNRRVDLVILGAAARSLEPESTK